MRWTLNGKAVFEVSQVWRGELPRIVSASNKIGCDSVFRVGEEYLVFSRRLSHDVNLGYDLVAFECGESGPLRNAQAALGLLGDGYRPERTSSQTGLIVAIAVLMVFMLAFGAVLSLRKLRPRPGVAGMRRSARRHR